MTHRTLILVATAVLGATLAVAPLASADRPIRQELPAADTSGQFCEDFQVLIHPTRNNEILTIFSSGAALINGALRVEVTNLDTGETIALNVSGPGRISEDGSTVTATGPSILFGEEGDLGDGAPAQVLFTTGPLVLTFDSEGNVAGFTPPRHTVDICAALAA